MARQGASATALAVTLAIQMFTSLAATSTAVLAPSIAHDLGVAPGLVGVFAGLLYVGGSSASLVSGGFIERHGAIRVSQASVLLCVAGVALMACVGSAFVAVAALAAVFIGLGYGPITPASSQILARTAPPSRMALTFSIKQTGVPVGTALAGAALPGLALALGWRAAVIAVAVLGVLIALMAQRTRESLDADRVPDRPLSVSGIFAPLKLVLGDRALIELAFTGFIYATTQMCLTSFLVVYLTESLDVSLIAAGFALTVANIGGIAGRIGFGAVVDHGVPPRVMLGLIGLAAGICSFATAGFGPNWPTFGMLGVSALFGATAVGWNGVQISEVARTAPPGRAAAITGASGFVTFSGVVLGPPCFALLSSITGSYRVGFAVFGSLSLLCGCRLLLAKRP
jgi:MFS family permease